MDVKRNQAVSETSLFNDARLRAWAVPLAGSAVLLASLYLASQTGYLLFHAIAEIVGIVISAAVFTLAWNTRRWLTNHYLLFVGIALIASSVLSLLHLLAYKGMGVFSWADADLPTQLWLARRYLESGALLIAPVFIRRRFPAWPMLLLFTGLVGAVLAAIWLGVFPVAYIEGAGLTPFKVTSEYIIAAMFLVAAFVLYRNRSHFTPDVARALIWSILAGVGAELLFTLYVGVYDLPNRLGHFMVLVSNYLVYIAIVRTGLVRPYELLSATNVRLTAEIAERRQAQDALRRQSEALQASRQQLRELSHRLVELQEEERKSLSRELHDRAGQAMTALKLNLSLLQLQMPPGHPTQDRLDDVLRMADGVMEDLHGLAVSLRPSALDRSGLLPALEQLAAAFEKQNGAHVTVSTSGLEGERLPPDIETTLYRIVQESLTNVSRHAQATKVGIELARRDGNVCLTLRDNGRGYDVNEALSRGRLGLLGMRERAEMVGATLRLESAPGKGSAVIVEAPLVPQPATVSQPA